MFLVNAHGRDRLPYFKETARGRMSFTNLATGKTVTQFFAINNKDLKMTDNGDGTLTLLVLGTGAFKIYAGGKLVLADPGQTRVEILIDHGGTPTDPSDDEVLDFLGVVKGSTGQNDLDGHDFCDDIRRLTA